MRKITLITGYVASNIPIRNQNRLKYLTLIIENSFSMFKILQFETSILDKSNCPTYSQSKMMKVGFQAERFYRDSKC